MLGLWGISNFMYYLTAPHMQFYPALDGLSGVFFAFLWSREKQGWQLQLSALFGAQCLMHSWYFSFLGTSFALRYLYDSLLNTGFVAELAVIFFHSYKKVARS